MFSAEDLIFDVTVGKKISTLLTGTDKEHTRRIKAIVPNDIHAFISLTSFIRALRPLSKLCIMPYTLSGSYSCNLGMGTELNSAFPQQRRECIKTLSTVHLGGEELTLKWCCSWETNAIVSSDQSEQNTAGGEIREMVFIFRVTPSIFRVLQKSSKRAASNTAWFVFVFNRLIFPYSKSYELHRVKE